MSYPPARNLRQYLERLTAERELVRIDAPVDADQEIAEIHRRAIAAGGPALLFTNVRGYDYSVTTNLFGTPRRVDLAFGSRPEAFVEQAARLAADPPSSLTGFWDARGLVRDGLRLGLERKQRGPVCEVVEQPAQLDRLPMLTCWPQDGGAFVTLPLVLTHSPSDNRPNLGIYRMQRFDEQTTGMHWQIGKGGGFHYHEAQRLGRPLDVTVFLGGPPAMILAAVAPLPEGVSEWLLASLGLGRRLPVVERPDAPHPLVAEAEFAMVGHVPPNELRPEGPFGDHYGVYSLRHDYPVFHCKKVFRRRDAIYPATVVGKPRQEDYFIGAYLQRLLRPIMPLVMPGVVDLWSYGETGFHALAAAVVRERYAREAMVSAFRILGEGQLSLTKFLLATDTPRDLTDFPGLLEHVLARFNPATDLYVFSNLSMDTLDYTGPEVNKGSKGIMLGLGDAVRDLQREWTGTLPNGARDPHVFCAGCLVLGGPTYKEDPEFAARLAAAPQLADWPLVILCDQPDRATTSTTSFLWTTFTRFEPAADLHAASTEVRRHHLAYAGPIVIDARMKPTYPDEVACAPDIARQVETRWKEYFPSANIEMGLSDPL